MENRELALFEELKNLVEQANNEIELSGERFNIFNLLQIESDEVSTHSRIIAYLLSRKKNHLKGNAFMNKFLSLLNIEGFNTENYRVKVEYYIGPISKDGKEGGRIDILLQDISGMVILIENKIYAIEQDNQLLRYRNAFPGATIIYLTLKGEPSQKNPEIECLNLSYESGITKWIEDCILECVDQPFIKETLNQYLVLIKKLTEQNIDNRMNEGIKSKLIEDKSSFETYVTLYNSANYLKSNMVTEISNKLCEIAKEEGFKNIDGINKNNSRGRLIQFTNDKLLQYDLYLRFNFEGDNYTILIFGFYNPNTSERIPDNVYDVFKDYYLKAKRSPLYPAYSEYDDFKDWYLRNLGDIYFDGEFYLDFREKLKVFSKMIDRL